MKLAEKLKEKESEIEKGYDTKFWKPEPGEIIEGKVDDMGTTITQFGDSDYVQIATEAGKVMVFANGLLKRLLDEEQVEVGDVIAIKFVGYSQSKKHKNKKFKNYILVKDDSSDEPETEAE